VSYLTIDEFKQAISVADTVDDADIQRALDAASVWIENYTGRVFTPQDAVLSTRRFDAKDTDRLSVPDVGSVTAVEVDRNLDGTFDLSLPLDSWQLYPLNVGLPGSIGNYTEIRLRPNTSQAFVPGEQVRITGYWGWPTDANGVMSLEPVKQANLLLANRYFLRPSAPFGVLEAAQTGELATIFGQDQDVINLLAPYVTASGSGRAASATWVLV